MRANMSAIGSVMLIVCSLPTGLCYSGDLTVMRHLPEAEAAQAEAAIYRAWTPTADTPRVLTHLELLPSTGLVFERLLCHQPSVLVSRNGNPSVTRRARPSSSFLAVVTMVMSIPLVASMSS